jgi:hypothetical protein
MHVCAYSYESAMQMLCITLFGAHPKYVHKNNFKKICKNKHVNFLSNKATAQIGTNGFFIWFVRLLALRPLLAYCASLG